MITLKSRNRSLNVSTPLVMGVINCTNDSFYAASRTQFEDDMRFKIDQMITDGADIIDVGGQSTRPGSTQIDENEEIRRIAHAIDYTANTHQRTWISIDTTRASVARYAIEHGAHVVNDISAGEMDPSMMDTVADLGVPFVCTHMQGRPDTMQENPTYMDVVEEIRSFFTLKITACRKAGINDIIVDPGFGFGKTLDHNYTLVAHLDAFQSLGCPVMVGFSRKSMICTALNTTPEHALNGTTVLNTAALLKGALLLRVHDVKQAVEAVRLIGLVNSFGAH